MGRRATVNMGSGAIMAGKRSSHGKESFKDIVGSFSEMTFGRSNTEGSEKKFSENRARSQTAGAVLGSVTEDAPASMSRQDTPTSLDSSTHTIVEGGEAQAPNSNRGSKALLPEPPPVSGLEALLAEQRMANERALQLNEMISLQLATERRSGLKKSSDEDSRQSSKGPAQPKTKPTVHIDLSEPLLSSHAHHDHHESGGLMPLGAMRGHSSHSSRSNHLSAADTKKKEGGGGGLMRGISTHLFPKNDGVKEAVGESLAQKALEEDKDEDIFKEDSRFTRMAQNPCYSNCTLLVIVLNTIWIAIDTDCNHTDLLAEAAWPFIIVENFFCTYFFLEMLIRYLASKSTRLALSDPWFLFDGFLVALMVWETWLETLLWEIGFAPSGNVGAGSVLRIFRIFRLLRVARTARVLSSVPELLILTKGILVAMRSVVVILGLLAFIIYIFSIVFTQLLAGTKTNTLVGSVFSTVPTSANFLLLQVLCGFDTDIADTLRQNSVICYILFLLYLLIGSMTILNMLIGILCDVVFTVADDHKEETFQREMQFKVQSLASSLDVNNRGVVAAADFEQVIQDPEVISSLDELGVDVAGLVEFAMFVYQDSEDLSYENFLHMVLQFRTGKPATVKDVMDLRKQVSGQIVHILEACEETGTQFRFLQSRMWQLDSKQKALSMEGSGKDEKLEKTEVKVESTTQSSLPMMKSNTYPSAHSRSFSVASSPASSPGSSNPSSPPPSSLPPDSSSSAAPLPASSTFASASLALAANTGTTPAANLTPNSSVSVPAASRTSSYPLATAAAAPSATGTTSASSLTPNSSVSVPPASRTPSYPLASAAAPLTLAGARNATPPILSPSSSTVLPKFAPSTSSPPVSNSFVPPRAPSSYTTVAFTPPRAASLGQSRSPPSRPNTPPLVSGASTAAPVPRTATPTNFASGPAPSRGASSTVSPRLTRSTSPASLAKAKETTTMTKLPFSPVRNSL